jgi:hypothetical protein
MNLPQTSRQLWSTQEIWSEENSENKIDIKQFNFGVSIEARFKFHE